MPGDAAERLALYFGCRRGLGHYLHAARETLYRVPADLGFPWEIHHMDGTLLKNGRHPDVCDGKVFWTCGGRPTLWFAFFWWDRSVDKRMGSNSGFYVRGFDLADRQAALDYAGTVFPDVVARQRHPLILQPGLAEIAADRRALQQGETK